MVITDWQARNEAKAQAEIDRRASIAARLQVSMDVYNAHTILNVYILKFDIFIFIEMA